MDINFHFTYSSNTNITTFYIKIKQFSSPKLVSPRGCIFKQMYILRLQYMN
eukprot:UN06132